jgi:hypothetical protein
MTLYLSNYMIEYEKFVDQLSFLWTCISILLSIFAIFYSYVSIIESQRQGNEIEKSYQAIKKENEHTGQLLELYLKSQTAILERVSRIEGYQSMYQGKQQPLNVNVDNMNSTNPLVSTVNNISYSDSNVENQ